MNRGDCTRFAQGQHFSVGTGLSLTTKTAVGLTEEMHVKVTVCARGETDKDIIPQSLLLSNKVKPLKCSLWRWHSPTRPCDPDLILSLSQVMWESQGLSYHAPGLIY